MPKKEWSELSKNIIQSRDSMCELCGSSSKLHCHEVWNWNLETREQTLEKLQCLCNKCHQVKHLGLTELFVSQGKLRYESVIEHFIKINGCEEWAFWKHRQEEFLKWQERSKYEWDLIL